MRFCSRGEPTKSTAALGHGQELAAKDAGTREQVGGTLTRRRRRRSGTAAVEAACSVEGDARPGGGGTVGGGGRRFRCGERAGEAELARWRGAGGRVALCEDGGGACGGVAGGLQVRRQGSRRGFGRGCPNEGFGPLDWLVFLFFLLSNRVGPVHRFTGSTAA